MDVCAKLIKFPPDVSEILLSGEWTGRTDGQPDNIMRPAKAVAGAEA